MIAENKYWFDVYEFLYDAFYDAPKTIILYSTDNIEDDSPREFYGQEGVDEIIDSYSDYFVNDFSYDLTSDILILWIDENFGEVFYVKDFEKFFKRVTKLTVDSEFDIDYNNEATVFGEVTVHTNSHDIAYAFLQDEGEVVYSFSYRNDIRSLYLHIDPRG